MEQPVTLGLPFALNRKVLLVNSKIVLDFVALSIDFFFLLLSFDHFRGQAKKGIFNNVGAKAMLRSAWRVQECSYYFLF